MKVDMAFALWAGELWHNISLSRREILRHDEKRFL